MTVKNERFVWALPFLDLFTCALGAVFMLTILSVQERQLVEASDPSGYFFITARYDKTPLTQAERAFLEQGGGLNLPSGFESPPAPDDRARDRITPGSDKFLNRPVAQIGDKGTVLVISARLRFGVTPANGGAGEITLPGNPTQVLYGNESGQIKEWPRDGPTANDLVAVFEGREYCIIIRWKQ